MTIVLTTTAKIQSAMSLWTFTQADTELIHPKTRWPAPLPGMKPEALAEFFDGMASQHGASMGGKEHIRRSSGRCLVHSFFMPFIAVCMSLLSASILHLVLLALPYLSLPFLFIPVPHCYFYGLPHFYIYISLCRQFCLSLLLLCNLYE